MLSTSLSYATGCIVILFLFAFPTKGKFPHLVASVSRQAKKTSSTELTSKDEVVLNFGEVPVQTTANKWIELHNFSPVSVCV